MTLAAVTAFQKSHGLPAAGYVGQLTWMALFTPAAKAKPAVTKPAVTTVAKKTVVAKAVVKKTAVKKAVVKKAAASRSSVRATVTAGRVCPAPGAGFGDGWGVARGGHSHQGMDLSGRSGSPILAIEDGVIVREGRQSNGALRIVFQGVSGSKFFYGHMSRDLVHAGARVSRGQVIGLMGDSGSPGQVHLHFEYWKSGGESAAVNPSGLLHSLC
jgi:murein DD-endopeptidase MepM/ murein hydrolase activator NlpD